MLLGDSTCRRQVPSDVVDEASELLARLNAEANTEERISESLSDACWSVRLQEAEEQVEEAPAEVPEAGNGSMRDFMQSAWTAALVLSQAEEPQQEARPQPPPHLADSVSLP